MNLPMRADLQIGNKFPDFELPDHRNDKHTLSGLLRGYPGVLIFGRGHFCPRDRRQFTNYVEHLQPELRVNACKMITVSVDNRLTTYEVIAALGADWPFLCDHERKLLYELEMVDTSDERHGHIYIPYTFVLDRDRTIYKIYNGWWYLGRPTVEDLRIDLRDLLSRRSDWVYPGTGRPD